METYLRLSQSRFYTSTHIGDCKTGAVLPAGDATEASLVLDDAVGDSHLAAKSRQEEDELKRV